MKKKLSKHRKRISSLTKWTGLTLGLAMPMFFMSAGNFSTFNNQPDEHMLSDYQKLKAEICEKVYKDITKTVKDTRKAPTFNFIYNRYGKPYYNAYYSPSNNTINFGEGIYDLATRFKKDSINVVATVMGHEIAHFYKDHGWAHAFGLANPDTEIKTNVDNSMYNSDDRSRIEAEADYYGGIFGYMTGYNTLAVGSEFFSELYDALNIPDETFGYPSRKDRMSIYDNSKKMLEKLIPVFKAANMLSLTKHYEKASMCYDYVINTFPSREMYNNAGVALAWEALALYSPEELKYVYPFGIDMDTRLDNAGTKGAGETKEEKRVRLLKAAKESFNDAVHIDENYAASYVNLALTHELLGEHEMALGLAAKAVKLADEQGNKMLAANGHIARGIVFANTNKKSDAKKEFGSAKDGSQIIAEANLDAVTNNGFAKLFKKKLPEEIEGDEELISDVGIEAIEGLFDDRDQFQITKISAQNDNRPETVVVSVEEEEFDAIIVATYGGYYGTKEEIEGFIMTKPGYDDETSRGITIGSKLKEVQEEYGKPTKLMGGSQATFLYYQKSGIIFLMDSDNKVSSWMIYGKVK
ncbi:MAG: hypothetical protein GY810_03735 [Aureispira sp.]|nr:hypothetical protein [Aureispira sp.]